jgi:small subunit ribosomal protein S20
LETRQELYTNIGNLPGGIKLTLRALRKDVKIFILKTNFGSLMIDAYFCNPKFSSMANHKATKKDVRQAAKRRDRNRYYGKTTRNAIRDLKENKEKPAYDESLPVVASMIDKLAKRGIIHKNKAANLKSKLARKSNNLAKAAVATAAPVEATPSTPAE